MQVPYPMAEEVEITSAYNVGLKRQDDELGDLIKRLTLKRDASPMFCS